MLQPSYITIEDLNVAGMMKNKHLSKAVASQKFYEFRIKLKANEDKLNGKVKLIFQPGEEEGGGAKVMS